MLIVLYDGLAAVLTSQLNFEDHKHSALQIALSLDGQELDCKTERGPVKGEALLIPPLIKHGFQRAQGHFLVILVDDESALSESVKNQQIRVLDASDFSEIRKFLSDEQSADVDPLKLRDMLFRVGLLKPYFASKVDERIQRLITRLKDDEDFSPSAKEAAETCRLSESRFLHLFKQELGLPFRKYLQWMKLRRTLKFLNSGRSLTEAAHAGGFSDSAHLSRFFTESFGLNPSEVLKNSRLIQVD